jgi:hypothetical protein
VVPSRPVPFNVICFCTRQRSTLFSLCYRDAILHTRLTGCIVADVEEAFVDRRAQADTRAVGECWGSAAAKLHSIYINPKRY